MSCMTSAQRAQCCAIIHGASLTAGAVGAGLAQFPGSDNAVITPIQITMTIALGRVFGIELTESGSKGIVLSGIGACVGRTASQLLVGWIPGVGNAVNAATAAAITEALGWRIAEDFAAETAE